MKSEGASRPVARIRSAARRLVTRIFGREPRLAERHAQGLCLHVAEPPPGPRHGAERVPLVELKVAQVGEVAALNSDVGIGHQLVVRQMGDQLAGDEAVPDRVAPRAERRASDGPHRRQAAACRRLFHHRVEFRDPVLHTARLGVELGGVVDHPHEVGPQARFAGVDLVAPVQRLDQLFTAERDDDADHDDADLGQQLAPVVHRLSVCGFPRPPPFPRTIAGVVVEAKVSTRPGVR